MIEAALVGALLAIGALIFLRGLIPPRVTLEERIRGEGDPVIVLDLPVDTGEGIISLRNRLALTLLRVVSGERLAKVQSDVSITRGDVLGLAVDKLYGAVGVAVLATFLATWMGVASTIAGGILVAAAGASIGYVLPDFELKRNAAVARTEFERALNAFVGLVAVSMSGGSGLITAMGDSAAVGSGWVFEMLRSTLSDARVHSEPIGRALDRLGRQLDVEGLIELAGAIGLAGDSGARIRETLIARAESGRKKEISEARTVAERTTANLGIPVGTLVIGWIGFLGYPAISSLLQGFV